MKKQNTHYGLFPLFLILFLSSEAAAEDTLKVEIENGTVTLSAFGLAENEFSCGYDASYAFNIQTEKSASLEKLSNVTVTLGECSARLETCKAENRKVEVENEKIKTEADVTSKYGEALSSCNKQAEIALYERIAFIALFVIILLVLAAFSKRKKND